MSGFTVELASAKVKVSGGLSKERIAYIQSRECRNRAARAFAAAVGNKTPISHV